MVTKQRCVGPPGRLEIGHRRRSIDLERELYDTRIFKESRNPVYFIVKQQPNNYREIDTKERGL